MNKINLQRVKEKFFANTQFLRKKTNTSIRTISNNTRVSFRKLKQYELYKLLPDLEILITYADYFYVSTDFLLGLIDDYDLSKIEPFKPTPDYFSADVDGIEFDEILQPINPCCVILKSLREESGITSTQLAKLIGTSEDNIFKWENCLINYPSIKYLILLSNFYDVTIDYLLGRTDDYDSFFINEDIISEEEKAAGAAATRKESITPIEDELLYTFRQVGKKHGEDTQKAIITMIEKML